MQALSRHRVQVKFEICILKYLCLTEGARLLGEIEEEAPSLTEPVVVGKECEAGVRGRFVLIQKEVAAADMWFKKVLVNHTQEGRIVNAD